jgi:hypothetical protein
MRGNNSEIKGYFRITSASHQSDLRRGFGIQVFACQEAEMLVGGGQNILSAVNKVEDQSASGSGVKADLSERVGSSAATARNSRLSTLISEWIR